MNKDIVLFDATCRLCSNTVRFITRYDRKSRFCFIPLDSEKGAEYIRIYGGNIGGRGTMMLISDGKVYLKSDAVLRILRSLNGLWPLLYGFRVIPKFIRDPVYEIVSRYRYRWFGPCVNCPEYKPC